MTFEERCIAHYGRVDIRVGKYPPKRPIVMPPPKVAEPEPAKKRPFPGTNRHRATLYNYDEDGINSMRQQGKPMAAIAAHYSIPVKTMESYIRKHKPRWEAEV